MFVCLCVLACAFSLSLLCVVSYELDLVLITNMNGTSVKTLINILKTCIKIPKT